MLVSKGSSYTSSNGSRLLIVGNPDPVHIGAHLQNAATSYGLEAELYDSREAFSASWPVAKFNWWMRGHRPSLLEGFSRKVVAACQRLQPSWLIATGICPLAEWALKEVGRLGVPRLNLLTDDPWNPAHRTSWFLPALKIYDHVFTPRRANIKDLKRLGCRRVTYLPFAYAPELHFSEPPLTPEEWERYAADLVFAGGADPDRVPLLSALIKSGIRVALYGSYWNRYEETRCGARGYADPKTLRKAIGGAKVSICLVRRANRDGHSMRTYEVPAVGACMLVEDTTEHRDLFGEDMRKVAYFNGSEEMLAKLLWLLNNDTERERMAVAAHELITKNGNTYLDRLKIMIESSSSI